VGRFDSAVDHPDLGRIEKGTISHERFYVNRWYNYFRFEHPAGTFRNYYINICMPPKLADGEVDYVDLDIDLIVWPDGRLITLDLDEFEANALRFAYPERVRRRTLETLAHLESILGSSRTPESVDRALQQI
jgi:protein associated with RNAse G/E